MTTPLPLPKPGSQAERTLRDRLKAVLDLPRAIIVLEGALDRKTLEETLQRASRGALGRAAALSRAELVGRLADLFHKDDATATALMRELDRAAHKERHIVASIDEAALDERLRSYRALDFRRERARLIWALLRDERATALAAAERVLDETFATMTTRQENDEALAAPAAISDEVLARLKEQLTGYEQSLKDTQRQLQQELGAKQGVERERAELVARLGAREKALRDEEQLRREDVAELARLRERIAHLEDDLRALDPDKARALVDENQRLRERVRALERAADRAGRVVELEDELAAAKAALVRHERDAAARADDIADQLRALQSRERAALHRVEELREQLREARVQLARGDAPLRPATGRVGVFVDEANLSASARRDLDSRLDYRALIESLVGDRPRACAVAFVVDAPETPPQKHQGFVTRLREQGWDVREKRAKVRADGSRKADWDMGIAMEILDVVDDIDVVVLGSGDGDFLPLVRRLRRLGKRVEIAAFRASTDEALIAGADAFTGLDGRFRLPR
jgi:uncharacterized LabA/DUF88 family protein